MTRTAAAGRAPARSGIVVAAATGVGALLAVAPATGAAIGMVATFVAWAIVSPLAFSTLVASLSTAIPKAGWLVGDFPVPVLLFALVGATVCLRNITPATGKRRRSVENRLMILLLLWLSFRLVALSANGGSLPDLLALVGWYALPPIMMAIGPALGTVRGRVGRLWTGALNVGLLIACGFGMLQQLFGLERTAVSGITIASGADYAEKPLRFEGGTKIPSTYQNGNVLGVITGIFFLVAVDRILRGKARRLDYLVAVASAVVSALSGSRTVVVGIILGLACLVLRSKVTGRTVRVLALGAIVFAVVVLLMPVLSARYSIGGKADVTAGRAEGWSEIIRTTSLTQFALGDSSWVQPGRVRGEGVIGAAQQVGLVGVALLVAVVWRATSATDLRRWRLLMIPVGVSFAIDSAYLVFPTLFLPIARMFSPVDPTGDVPAAPSAEDQLGDDLLGPQSVKTT